MEKEIFLYRVEETEEGTEFEFWCVDSTKTTITSSTFVKTITVIDIADIEGNFIDLIVQEACDDLEEYVIKIDKSYEEYCKWRKQL